MSHRISLSEAKEKFEWEQHCRELQKAGLQVSELPRWRKKQVARMSKTERFMKMLFSRGGHIKQKKPKKKGEQNVQETSDIASS